MVVYSFPKGICPKVNVIVRLEYELAYYDSAIHHFNHYTTWTLPHNYYNLEYLFLKTNNIQLYNIKYFCLIQQTYTQFYGYNYSYLIQIIIRF